MTFPLVGVIGASEATRLLYPAAIFLGIPMRVLAKEGSDSAASVVADCLVGDSTNAETLTRFLDGISVVITDGEQDSDVLELCGERLAQPVDLMRKVSAMGIAGRRGEFAVTVARSSQGQAACWSVSSLGFDGEEIMKTVTPAVALSEGEQVIAQSLALACAAEVALIGVMTIFLAREQDGLVITAARLGPEVAGYWTLDGAQTSVFEQHLRAVLNLPMGSTAMRTESIVTQRVIAGDKPDMYYPYLHLYARDPALRIHQYGIGARPGQVVAHVSVMGSDVADLNDRAFHAAMYMSGAIEE